jgi:hypothetical protein
MCRTCGCCSSECDWATDSGSSSCSSSSSCTAPAFTASTLRQLQLQPHQPPCNHLVQGSGAIPIFFDLTPFHRRGVVCPCEDVFQQRPPPRQHTSCDASVSLPGVILLRPDHANGTTPAKPPWLVNGPPTDSGDADSSSGPYVDTYPSWGSREIKIQSKGPQQVSQATSYGSMPSQTEHYVVCCTRMAYSSRHAHVLLTTAGFCYRYKQIHGVDYDSSRALKSAHRSRHLLQVRGVALRLVLLGRESPHGPGLGEGLLRGLRCNRHYAFSCRHSAVRGLNL